MDKPTCKTCPYWDEENKYAQQHPWLLDEMVEYATCRIASPSRRNGYEGARTWADYWCGEHPDFPKYIEHRKSLEGGDGN